MLQLATSDKYISVSEWQGVTRIHIRTYFNSNGSAAGGGELIPTKKGVALTIDEWKALKAHVDHIDAMIAFSEDEHILGRKSSSVPAPTHQPQSLIPDICQYKLPSTQSIARHLSHKQRITPYQQLYEAEPFDK